MKLTIDRKAMLDVLATVAAVVPSRSPKPVLLFTRGKDER